MSVIPLSRGHKIPVEVARPHGGTDTEGGGNLSHTFNLILPGMQDVDTFKRSRSQIEFAAAASVQRVMTNGWRT